LDYFRTWKKNVFLRPDLNFSDSNSMTKITEEPKVQPSLDIDAALDKTESYINENKKSLALIVGGVLALVLVYFAWKFIYQEPRKEEAAIAMYKAEMYWQRDSFNLAINGRGDTLGMAAIAEEYGSTPAGNLANYYLGVSYLRTGQWDLAIEALEDFSSDDMFLSSMSIGMIGDAYMEKGDVDHAIEYYLKAANKNANKFTSPTFLKKAAFAEEDRGNKGEALKLYEQIKVNYPESQDAAQIDKYITRAGGTVK